MTKQKEKSKSISVPVAKVVGNKKPKKSKEKPKGAK